MLHDFADSLRQSHEAEKLPIWGDIYKRAFPDMVNMVSYREDGFWQRQGIDRGVLLKTSKQLRIDEKIRGRNKKTGMVYDDIALEYLSNAQKGTPGWVCKPLLADYIAYLIAPLGVCHLLPVLQLQNAWAKYGEDWKEKYFIIKAPNKGYTTYSVAIPVKELYPAIGSELHVSFDKFEIE